MKLALQSSLKYFLEVLEQCYRYLKGCPSLALSNGNKIMIIGHLNPEISKTALAKLTYAIWAIAWKAFQTNDVTCYNAVEKK